MRVFESEENSPVLVATARAWGKVRRFLLSRFRTDYVRAQAKRRRGECRRCGDCCRISFRCPFLKGGNSCIIYERRPLPCRIFPADERDLRDVPTCTFYFDEPGKRRESKSDAAGGAPIS